MVQDKVCRSLSFLPCIVQFDWLISDQLQDLLHIYQFDCSVLFSLIEKSSNKSTKSTSCFIFVFDVSKKKFNKKILKKAMVGISRKIWWKTWRLLSVPNTFFSIWDFPCLKLGIRDFQAKSGQDSGLKVCVGGGIPKTTLGITGLHQISGRNYRIEEPYWGPM